MNDNFNLIAQSRYYLKRFNELLKRIKDFNDLEQEYVLREMALLIQESIELCVKGLVELLVGIDYKHTHLISDNVLLIRNHHNDINNYTELEKILDEIDKSASRISDFHTKAVYINAFATSIVELNSFGNIAVRLHEWIDKSLKA